MASPRTSTPSNTASPAPPPTPSSNQPYQGDIEKRHFKADKVDLKRTSSDIRNNCIGIMYNGLAYRSTESVESVLAKATEVEAAAFKHFKGEGAEYRTKIRSLFSNLKVKSNRELGRKVMASDITPADFVKMSQDELKSQEHRDRDKELEKENMNKAQVAQPEKSISDALTCGKCGQKKVSYSQAQTRSADEPMTTFCECLVCGNRWKVSPSHCGGPLPACSPRVPSRDDEMIDVLCSFLEPRGRGRAGEATVKDTAVLEVSVLQSGVKKCVDECVVKLFCKCW